MRARTRPGAAIGIAALMLALLPWSAAAQQTSNRGIDDACPSAAPDAFDDDDPSVHEDAVDCIAFWGITQGTGSGKYSPSGNVSRAAMATFIANTMVTAGFDFDSSPPDAFTDDDPSVHEDNINRLADAGVVDGVSSTRYDPDRLVTRDQMAKFIARALEVASSTNITTNEDFFDDDEGNTFEQLINELASIGVVTGTGGRNYSPGRDVDRASMASFIARGGDYLHEQGDWPRAFVLLDSDTVAAGDDVTGELGPVSDEDEVTSATVSGCGLTNEPVEDTSASQAGVQFSEEIPASQDTGDCALTFTVDMAEGADETVAVGITVTEAAAPEAADGTHTDVDVVSVDRNGNSLIGTGDTQNHGSERFFYDGGDEFRFDGATITFAEFEAMLTGPDSQSGTDGDVLTVSYDDDPSGTSTFNVTTDNVPPSPDVVAEVIDADGDGAKDDVRITWSPSSQPDAVYDVFRDEPTTDDDEIGLGDEEVASDEEGTTVTVNDQPDGTYNYLVRAESPTSESQSEEAASDDVTVPGEADGGPESENLVQTTVAGTASDAGDGDVWRFAFDAPLAAPNDGDAITLVEGDDVSQDPIGTGGAGSAEEETTVTHGTNASFALNGSATTVNGVSYPTGHVLTITLTADLTPGQALPNGDGNITYPLTVESSAGVTGTDDEESDWAASFDRTVESDTVGPAAASLTANDVDASATVTSGDRIVADFNEEMSDSPEEPRPDAITLTDSGNDSVTLTHGSNATFNYSDPDPTDDDDATTRLTISVQTNASAVAYGAGTTVTARVYITDTAGNGWNLAAGDSAVEASTDTTAPQMTGAVGDATTPLSADEITVTYNEAVTCSSAAPSQFVYDADGNATTTGDRTAATGIACDDDTTIVLTFPNGTYEAGRAADSLTYTQSATSANRVKDLNGNDATSPQTVAVTDPA